MIPCIHEWKVSKVWAKHIGNQIGQFLTAHMYKSRKTIVGAIEHLNKGKLKYDYITSCRNKLTTINRRTPYNCKLISV